MTDLLREDLRDAEAALLKELRAQRRRIRECWLGDGTPGQLTLGQKIADQVAATMGSWRFIIIQTCALMIWVALNVTMLVYHWDPYPVILLNLALSFQAAYAAPFIMMSQNRQQEIDRQAAEGDHQVNLKAELEIELLHQKVDALREQEFMLLTQSVRKLTEMLTEERAARGGTAAAG